MVLSNEEVEKRLKLYAEGLSDRQMAKKVGISKDGLSMWRWRRGLPANPVINWKETEVKSLDIATRGYLAGMIDGEGTIAIYRKKSGKLDAWLQITNTNLSLLAELKELTGVGAVVNHRRKEENRKLAYDWIVTKHTDIFHLLPQIIPHLRVKRKQADLMLDFCESRLNQRSHAPFTKHEYEIFEALKELNQRGDKILLTVLRR